MNDLKNNIPHFAIPEIYGESLSYYEILRNLVNAMNDVIENYDTIPDQIAEAVKDLDASQLFSAVINQIIHSIATDNTKSTNAVKVYKKHDILYATFNKTVNLYESLIDFKTGTETELIVGTNIREVNISELLIDLSKLIDANKNNIEAVSAVVNENSAEIATMRNDITAIENKNNEQDNELSTLHTDITNIETDIINIENKNNEQDNELSTLHTDIINIENKNNEQDNELSTLRTMLSSPYNFKGDVASISALPSSGNVNDTYYVEDVKHKVTWTGSAWVQSSMSEADYQTEMSKLKSDIDDVNTVAVNGEAVYFYQEHPKSSYYTENVNLKANQTYTIYVDSTAQCAVTIRDSSDNRNEIVNTWGEATKEFTPKTDITSLILWINDTTSPTSQTFIVKIYRGKIKDEIKKLNKTQDIKVEKDGTGDFTKLVDAVNYVNSNSSIKFTVHVGSGTYDLIEELGNDYFENFRGVGLVLNHNAHYIFSSNSKVVCNYVGKNENIKKYFSPFNCSTDGKHTGFILENLTLECANVRYAIHDEVNGQIAPFKNEYINCRITLNNSENNKGYRQCIGGGLGCASEVIIKNCYFKSIGTSNSEIVTYHNVNSLSNDNYRSNVTIDSCYFADTNTCRCSYCGISENISRMIVSNCSLGAEPRIIAETASTLVNFELIKWNNEIRN